MLREIIHELDALLRGIEQRLATFVSREVVQEIGGALRGIERRLATIERSIQRQGTMFRQSSERELQAMATTRQDIIDSVNAAKAAAAAEADEVKAAVIVMHQFADMLQNAVVSARDFDDLKVAIDGIAQSARSNAEDLGQAIVSVPAPAP